MEMQLPYVLLFRLNRQLNDETQGVLGFAGVDDPDILTPHSSLILGFDGLA